MMASDDAGIESSDGHARDCSPTRVARLPNAVELEHRPSMVLPSLAGGVLGRRSQSGRQQSAKCGWLASAARSLRGAGELNQTVKRARRLCGRRYVGPAPGIADGPRVTESRPRRNGSSGATRR
jgi:hypothetical protein